MMASLGNFETPNFETLGEIGESENRNAREKGASGNMSENRRFYTTQDRWKSSPMVAGIAPKRALFERQ